VGQRWELPTGYDAQIRGYVSRFHYTDDEETDDTVIEVVEQQGQRYRVRIGATCSEVGSHDESLPRTRIAIDAWFTPPRGEPVYAMSRIDKLLCVALVGLTGLVCACAYCGSRFAFDLALGGAAIGGLLATVIAPLFAFGGLSPSYAGKHLQQFAGRVLFVVALGLLPLCFGYGLVEMGLRHRIESLFTPALIAELRAIADGQLRDHPTAEPFTLAAADLPRPIRASPWRFPPRVTVTPGTSLTDTKIRLEWSSHVGCSFGIVLTDVPLRDAAAGHDGQTSPPRYTPWLDHSYVFTRRDER